MIYQTYIPQYPLSQFIDWFWFFEGLYPDYSMERVMPQGVMELIINLQSVPKRLFNRDNFSQAEYFQRAWISGVHSEFIVIEATENSSMMGAHFKPGGGYPFFGCSVAELTNRVVNLEALWGSRANQIVDQLTELAGPKKKFQALEKILIEMAVRPLAPELGIAHVLKQLSTVPDVQQIKVLAGELGISHKHFIEKFSQQVGITPKVFCRLRRFQRVLQEIEHSKAVNWSQLAVTCGYYDQAHFIHDFNRFAGMNPSAYLVERGTDINFLPYQNHR